MECTIFLSENMTIETDDGTFPIIPGINLDWTATGNARKIQNVLNLISTWRYEVGYDRTKGLDPTILDRPALEAKAMYTAEIYRLIQTYATDVTLKNVNVSAISSEGDIEAKVVIEI